MSITRSYNRHTNTYYAYETEYVFDTAKQKKVPKRRCVGKYDSDGNIIPTGNRGRRKAPFPTSNKELCQEQLTEASGPNPDPLTDILNARKHTIDNAVTMTASLVNELEADVDNIKATIGNLHSKLSDTQDKLSTVVAMLHDLTDTDPVHPKTSSTRDQ